MRRQAVYGYDAYGFVVVVVVVDVVIDEVADGRNRGTQMKSGLGLLVVKLTTLKFTFGLALLNVA
jgi:hypothetical protein